MAERKYLNADTLAIFRKTEENTKAKLIGAQTSVSVSLTPNYTEVTAMDIEGTEQFFQGYSWTVDISGHALESETELNELFQATMTGKEFTIVFNVAESLYEGVAKIGSFELSGESKALGSYKIPLLGSGELKISTIVDGGA